MLAATAHHRRIRALLGVAAVVILAGGQLGMLAHNAFVQHRVCAEHQALEHGGDEHDEHEHRLAALPPADMGAETAVRGLESDPDGDEHENCGLTSVTREPVCQDAAPATSVPPRARVCGAAMAPGAVVAGLVSYRLAPKQSPPA